MPRPDVSVILSGGGRPVDPHPHRRDGDAHRRRHPAGGPRIEPADAEPSTATCTSPLCFCCPHLPRDFQSCCRRPFGGVSTSLDTNWDPDERWAGVEGCLPHLDVFLPNATEAMALARSLGGDPENADEAARMLADRGPIVAVKDGARGGFAVAGEQFVRASGLAVDVVDTTGAGDSFDAGFLAGWLAGHDLSTALRWGTAAGSLSTQGAGGTGAQPTPAELSAALVAASGPAHAQ